MPYINFLRSISTRKFLLASQILKKKKKLGKEIIFQPEVNILIFYSAHG
jgi:hypothetical protein